ncbi:hypothetical protein [Nitrobacter sp.]|uniref:hypothetical protein n=1 Tax=Nitrobacter sp. TaxID=29420 RepID=UPI00399D68DC
MLSVALNPRRKTVALEACTRADVVERSGTVDGDDGEGSGASRVSRAVAFVDRAFSAPVIAMDDDRPESFRF